jgi:ABC-type transport system substrate-binding protein
VQFNSNKYFKPTRDFNADDVLFSVLRQKDASHPYHNVSQGITNISTTLGWIS